MKQIGQKFIEIIEKEIDTQTFWVFVMLTPFAIFEFQNVNKSISITGMNFLLFVYVYNLAFLRNFKDEGYWRILIISVGISRVCFDLYAVERKTAIY